MTVFAKPGPIRFANGCGRFFQPSISRIFEIFVVNQIRFWTGVILDQDCEQIFSISVTVRPYARASAVAVSPAAWRERISSSRLDS